MDIFDMLTDIRGDVDETEVSLEAERERPDLINVRDGEEFTFRGIKFIRLGLEQGGVLCITKEELYNLKFNRERNNNYKDSIIRRTLLDDFLPKLADAELLPFTMDLIAENGETDYGTCTEYVGILTLDLFRKYRKFVLPVSDYLWTCTPFSCMNDYQYVLSVGSSGSVNDTNANNAYRCRPACIFPI